MKKIAAILLSAILACSFMVGCGDDDDSSSKKSGKNDSEVSAVDESKGGDDESKADESKEDESKGDESSEDEASKADESKPDESKPDESKADGPADTDTAAYEGKWECESMKIFGQVFDDNFMGVPIALIMQIELKPNGAAVHYENDGENINENEFTWKVNGNVCTFTLDGEDVEFEFKDGKLIAEYTEDDVEEIVTLKKVDKFTEFEGLSDEDLADIFGDLGDLLE